MTPRRTPTTEELERSRRARLVTPELERERWPRDLEAEADQHQDRGGIDPDDGPEAA